MSDLADRADAYIQKAVQEGIASALVNENGLKPIGVCRWCGDPVDQGRTHCRPIDNACAEDHAKYQRNKQGV